jgi:hypothetical protein
MKIQEIKDFAVKNDISLIEAIEFYKLQELSKLSYNLDIEVISQLFEDLKNNIYSGLADIALQVSKNQD